MLRRVGMMERCSSRGTPLIRNAPNALTLALLVTSLHGLFFHSSCPPLSFSAWSDPAKRGSAQILDIPEWSLLLCYTCSMHMSLTVASIGSRAWMALPFVHHVGRARVALANVSRQRANAAHTHTHAVKSTQLCKLSGLMTKHLRRRPIRSGLSCANCAARADVGLTVYFASSTSPYGLKRLLAVPSRSCETDPGLEGLFESCCAFCKRVFSLFEVLVLVWRMFR